MHGEILDLGVQCGIVDKSGAWYAYNGDKIGQGKANASKFLEDNPEVAKTIEQQIRDQLLVPADKAAKEEALEEA